MNYKTVKTRIFATIFVCIIALGVLISSINIGNAQMRLEFDTTNYLSVSPSTIGLNQPLLVNLWIYPPPSGPAPPTIGIIDASWTDISVTFTKPDGSIDSFKPVEPGLHFPPGSAELIGAIWFNYYPNQVGTWKLVCNFPGKTFTDTEGNSVFWRPSTSQTVTFTVQADPVQIFLPSVELPGPNDYWESPINSDNREWSQISGDWLQSGYDASGSGFNPYSKAPNTAHVLWKQQISPGGIIGGDFGSLSYYTTGLSPPVITLGNVYYNIPGGKFRCQDLRTGQIKWEQPGSITRATRLPTPLGVRTTYWSQEYTKGWTPYLIGEGNGVWNFYDPFSGNLLRTLTNVPRIYAPPGAYSGFVNKWRDGDPIVYGLRYVGWNATRYLRYDELVAYKWNYSQLTSNDWTTGIVWNVSLQHNGRAPGEARGHVAGGLWVAGDAAAFYTFDETIMAAIDLNTGDYLWQKDIGYVTVAYGQIGLDGPVITFDCVTRKVHAYDVKTGNQLWVSETLGEYPWASDAGWFMSGAAYGMVFAGTYDGHVYSLDATTGQLRWKSDSAGETTETPYNTWAFYSSPITADGKIYLATTEHTPTQPLPRGNKLFCFDATNGKEIWNISGAMPARAVAEGYLITASESDGFMYCIGKGLTETTVMASPKVPAKGASVVIEGTVMDMSPAQPGTPAIADEDMSAWMNYKHMDRLRPMTAAEDNNWGTAVNVRGVPVKLTAVKPDGSTIDIGTVTSDGEGFFKKMWTTPDTGEYTIVASFEGSGAYWPSKAETALGVTAAAASPSPTPTATAPPPGEPAPVVWYVIASLIVVIIVVVAIAIIMRRRK